MNSSKFTAASTSFVVGRWESIKEWVSIVDDLRYPLADTKHHKNGELRRRILRPWHLSTRQKGRGNTVDNDSDGSEERKIFNEFASEIDEIISL